MPTADSNSSGCRPATTGWKRQGIGFQPLKDASRSSGQNVQRNYTLKLGTLQETINVVSRRRPRAILRPSTSRKRHAPTRAECVAVGRRRADRASEEDTGRSPVLSRRICAAPARAGRVRHEGPHRARRIRHRHQRRRRGATRPGECRRLPQCANGSTRRRC